MADTTADTARYQQVVDRYRELLGRSIGDAISVEAAEPSPDGSLVAVVLRVRDALEGRGHAELHVLSSDGRERWQVTGADVDASDPRWSRSGTLLTFLADIGTRHRPAPHALDVAGIGPTGAPRRLPSPAGIPELQRPTPDGTRLLIVVAGVHAEVADGLGSGTAGELAEDEQDRPGWAPTVETTGGADEWRTAWVVDLASGDAERVSPDGINTWEADWAGPDAIVAVVSDGPAEDAWYEASLVRFELAAPRAMTTLYRPEWQIEFAAGAPDGRHVAAIEGVASDRYFMAGELILATTDGAGARPLSTGSVDVLALRWIDDAQLLVVGLEGMQSVLGVAGIDGSWTETWRTDAVVGGTIAAIAALPDGGAVLALDGPDEPERLVAVGRSGERTILSLRTPADAELAAAQGHAQVVAWAGRDGTRVEALLRVPSGSPPFPMILWVHGGPVGAVGCAFPRLHEAILLEAGYAILQPNPRGSTGRGRAYAAAVVGDMGGEDSYDLLAGVEWAIAEGLADPARVAVGGVSYGGFMAAHLPTLTDRFAAAIVASPLTDMIAAYHGSSLTAFVRDYVGGQPATDTERYLRVSPVFAGTRLRTPTLITNGARDRATPVGQAVELFRAIREQGVDAELAIYPTEGHGFSDAATRADWAGRTIVWLERYMPARDREG